MKNLNSDQLRAQLHENNCAMNILAEDNQEIVELLSQRGLQAINYSSDLEDIRILLERRAETAKPEAGEEAVYHSLSRSCDVQALAKELAGAVDI